MQTLSVPYQVTKQERVVLETIRRGYSCVVRSVYTALRNDAKTDLKKLTPALYLRHKATGIDAWLVHCASLDAQAMVAAEAAKLDSIRRKKPNDPRLTTGLPRAVFGGKALMRRRSAGLIDRETWRKARLRPLNSIGKRQALGNLHFRLADEGRICRVAILGQTATLHLAPMHGNWGKLLQALCRVAPDKEVAIQFRLDHTHLHLTFNEMDLRRLAPGDTLTQARDRDLAAKGHKARGRPRTAHYVMPTPKVRAGDRPVHPQWKDRIRPVKTRMIGLDQNPDYLGITVIEVAGDPERLSSVTILDSAIIRYNQPLDVSRETTREVLANAAGRVIAMARAWHVGAIAYEDGLGFLRSGTRSRPLNRMINGWGRNVFLSGLTRRATLSGITLLGLSGAYSTTIGNLCFDLPDPAAAAAEIARRGYARAVYQNSLQDSRKGGAVSGRPCGTSGPGLLPVYEAHMIRPHDLWKDGVVRHDLSPDWESVSDWPTAHGKLKMAHKALSRRLKQAGESAVGYRRPLPGCLLSGVSRPMGAGRPPWSAVDPMGRRGVPGWVAKRA